MIIGNGDSVEYVAESWSRLPVRSQGPAWAAAMALAEQFGVKEDDFLPLTSQDDVGKLVLSVVYARDSGIDLGDPTMQHDARRSWRNIFDTQQDAEFQLGVDGVFYDSRTGMTRPVYEALVDYKHHYGLTLPDSQQLEAAAKPERWTWTLLTGVGKLRDCAYMAYVLDGKAATSGGGLTNDLPNIRFRPAIEIAL